MPRQDDREYKFNTYRVKNLDYDMLCEPISSDNQEKEGENLSSNCLINIKILISNIDILSVCQTFQERRLYI